MSEEDWVTGETRRVAPKPRNPLLDFFVAVAVGYRIGQDVSAAAFGNPPPPPRPGAPKIPLMLEQLIPPEAEDEPGDEDEPGG